MAPPIRVLVVDDSAFMRRALIRRIEEDARFKVIDSASDGKEGVEKALRLRPDIVTLDVEMPVLNGLEALRAIVGKSNIPVVMVSAITVAGAKITLEALEIGAIDFIAKSRDTEHLHEKLFAAANAKIKRRAPSPTPIPALPMPAGVGLAPAGSPLARPAPATAPPAPIARDARAAKIAAKIVIIGSSTGGPQALQQVIGALGRVPTVPVVIAQHMPPHFTAALAKRLSETCRQRVVEAADGDTLTPGTIYIAPGGMQTRVTANSIKVSPDKGESLYKPSVDVLAESALAAFGRNILGVMLTGMGNDGTREFVRIKKTGGYNLSQDQASCVVFGMPRSLQEAGGADEIVSLDNVGGRITALLGA